MLDICPYAPWDDWGREEEWVDAEEKELERE